MRWNDWKISFASLQGNIADGVRFVTNWPTIVNLRADPCEKAQHESGMYIRWMADNMWLFVPLQQKLKEFLVTIPQYPFQEGMNMSAGDVNYNTLKAAQALKSLQYLTDNAVVPTD